MMGEDKERRDKKQERWVLGARHLAVFINLLVFANSTAATYPLALPYVCTLKEAN